MGCKQASQLYSSNQIQKLDEDIIIHFLKQNEYEYKKVLEKGDFSYVVIAFSYKLCCQVVIRIFKDLERQGQKTLQQFERKVQSMQKLKNERYVLRFVEKIQDEQQGLVAIITQHYDTLPHFNNYKGNLTTILELNKLSLEQIIAITYQLMKGLIELKDNAQIAFYIAHLRISFYQQTEYLYNLYKQLIMNQQMLQKVFLHLKPKMQIEFIFSCNQSSVNFNRSRSLVTTQQSKSSNINEKIDLFSIGILLIEAILQRKLSEKECLDLEKQNLLEVFPFLQRSKHFHFISQVILKMIDPHKEQRLSLEGLLKNLLEFSVNENSLNQLKFQKYKKLLVNKKNIEDISKAIDHEILEINLGYLFTYRTNQFIIQIITPDTFFYFKPNYFLNLLLNY